MAEETEKAEPKGLLGNSYIIVYATIMSVWITYTSLAEYSLGNISGLYGFIRHAFDEGAHKWGFVWSVTIAIMEGGPGTMVLGAFEKHVLGPRREAIQEAREAKERVAAWKAWNERRLAAEARQEPFSEPPPDDEPGDPQ